MLVAFSTRLTLSIRIIIIVAAIGRFAVCIADTLLCQHNAIKMRVHPQGPGVTLLIVQSILILLTTMTTSLRVFVRVGTRAFGLDDWLMEIGYVSYQTVLNVMLLKLY